MTAGSRFRFTGWGAAGWYLCAVMLAFFGVVDLAKGVSQSSFLPVALIAAALVLIVQTLSVRLDIGEGSVVVKNHWRKHRLPVTEIRQITSVTTVVAVLSWPPYAQLVIVRCGDEKPVPVAASTGVSPARAREMVERITRASPGPVDVQVDYASFPTRSPAF